MSDARNDEFQPIVQGYKANKSTMAMPINNGGGPQWANPDPSRADAVMTQEEEFFAPLSTLDEPVMETIMRDVRAVASKLKVVMLPMERNVSFMSAVISSIHEIYGNLHFVIFPIGYRFRMEVMLVFHNRRM